MSPVSPPQGVPPHAGAARRRIGPPTRTRGVFRLTKKSNAPQSAWWDALTAWVARLARTAVIRRPSPHCDFLTVRRPPSGSPPPSPLTSPPTSPTTHPGAPLFDFLIDHDPNHVLEEPPLTAQHRASHSNPSKSPLYPSSPYIYGRSQACDLSMAWRARIVCQELFWDFLPPLATP